MRALGIHNTGDFAFRPHWVFVLLRRWPRVLFFFARVGVLGLYQRKGGSGLWKRIPYSRL